MRRNMIIISVDDCDHWSLTKVETQHELSKRPLVMIPGKNVYVWIQFESLQCWIFALVNFAQ